MEIDFSDTKTHDIVIANLSNDGYSFDVIGDPPLIEALSQALKGTPIFLLRTNEPMRGRVCIPETHNRPKVIGKIVEFFKSQGASVRVD